MNLSLAARGLNPRMPAEWEPHAATWLAWPHNREDWPNKFGPIPWVYAEIVRHVAASEPVWLLVRGDGGAENARDVLERAAVPLDAVTMLPWKTDRVWLRDTGPSFVVAEVGGPGPPPSEASAEFAVPDPVATDVDDARIAAEDWKAQVIERIRAAERASGPRLYAVDWRFNAWAKYDDYKKDARIPRRIAANLGISRIKPTEEIDGEPTRIVLEGGAIDVNGAGSLLTTEECLLSEVQARNPGLDRAAMERAFADYLGCPNTIWLGRGIAGDDTHGHVDDIARFVATDTIVAAVESNPSDPNFEPLRDNMKRLQTARDANGSPFRVVTLPMPRPVVFAGQRLPASYANFYITNRSVLVPTFNDPADRVALKTLADLFLGREVVGIHAIDLVWGLGTLHCLSREQPAVISTT